MQFMDKANYPERDELNEDIRWSNHTWINKRKLVMLCPDKVQSCTGKDYEWMKILCFVRIYKERVYSVLVIIQDNSQTQDFHFTSLIWRIDIKITLNTKKTLVLPRINGRDYEDLADEIFKLTSLY